MLGTAWRHQGRSPVHGVDCIGLVVVAAWSAGLVGERELTRQVHYGRLPLPGQLEAELAPYTTPVEAPAPGDLALIAWRTGGAVNHVGIVAALDGRPSLIHALATVKRVVEVELTEEVRRMIVGYLRPRAFQ